MKFDLVDMPGYKELVKEMKGSVDKKNMKFIVEDNNKIEYGYPNALHIYYEVMLSIESKFDTLVQEFEMASKLLLQERQIHRSIKTMNDKLDFLRPFMKEIMDNIPGGKTKYEVKWSKDKLTKRQLFKEFKRIGDNIELTKQKYLSVRKELGGKLNATSKEVDKAI